MAEYNCVLLECSHVIRTHLIITSTVRWKILLVGVGEKSYSRAINCNGIKRRRPDWRFIRIPIDRKVCIKVHTSKYDNLRYINIV